MYACMYVMYVLYVCMYVYVCACMLCRVHPISYTHAVMFHVPRCHPRHIIYHMSHVACCIGTISTLALNFITPPSITQAYTLKRMTRVENSTLFAWHEQRQIRGMTNNTGQLMHTHTHRTHTMQHMMYKRDTHVMHCSSVRDMRRSATHT